MIKIITHDDLDGFGTNIICKLVEKTNPEIKFHIDNCSYGNVNMIGYKLLKGIEGYENFTFDELIITDISFNDKMTAWIDSSVKEKVLLDHHISNRERLKCYDWCKIEENGSDGKLTCGTKMFYEYCLEKGWLDDLNILQLRCLRDFVLNIRDYDTWLWSKDNNTIPRDLNELFLLKRDDLVDKIVAHILNGIGVVEFVGNNRTILDTLEKVYQNFKKNKMYYLKDITIDNLNGVLLFTSEYASRLGNDIVLETGKDFCLLIDLDRSSGSIRSIGNVDVSKIAQKYGGNGHHNASGFRLDKDKVSEIVESLFIK